MCEPCKTAEPIEMSFAVWTLVGPGNHVLGGGPDPLRGGALLRSRIWACLDFPAVDILNVIR